MDKNIKRGFCDEPDCGKGFDPCGGCMRIKGVLPIDMTKEEVHAFSYYAEHAILYRCWCLFQNKTATWEDAMQCAAIALSVEAKHLRRHLETSFFKMPAKNIVEVIGGLGPFGGVAREAEFNSMRLTLASVVRELSYMADHTGGAGDRGSVAEALKAGRAMLQRGKIRNER